MSVLLSIYGSPWDLEPMVGFAAQMGVEELDARVVTGVASTGVSR